MEQSISTIIIIELITTFLCYGLIVFINIWIYYRENKEKFPLFPFLNPFSFTSFELIFSSMFTFFWKEKKPNLKLKKIVNNTSKVFGILILTTIITIIVNVILF